MVSDEHEDCKHRQDPVLCSECKDESITALEAECQRLRALMDDAELVILRQREARKTLEAENRWFKEAFGVRDAEDQMVLDSLKNELSELREVSFQKSEAHTVTMGKLLAAEAREAKLREVIQYAYTNYDKAEFNWDKLLLALDSPADQTTLNETLAAAEARGLLKAATFLRGEGQPGYADAIECKATRQAAEKH